MRERIARPALATLDPPGAGRRRRCGPPRCRASWRPARCALPQCASARRFLHGSTVPGRCHPGPPECIRCRPLPPGATIVRAGPRLAPEHPEPFTGPARRSFEGAARRVRDLNVIDCMTLPERARAGLLVEVEALPLADVLELTELSDRRKIGNLKAVLLDALSRHDAGGIVSEGACCDLLERERDRCVTWLPAYSLAEACAGAIPDHEPLSTLTSANRSMSAERLLRWLQNLRVPPKVWIAHITTVPGSLLDVVALARHIVGFDPNHITPASVFIAQPAKPGPIFRDSLRAWLNDLRPDVRAVLFPSDAPLWLWMCSNNTTALAVDKKDEQRIKIIAEELRAVGVDDLLSVQAGIKKEIRGRLCKQQPRLFTESTFDAAWKKGSSASPPVFRIVNRDLYVKGAQ